MFGYLLLFVLFSGFACKSRENSTPVNKPNILLVFSNDQSYLHATVYSFDEAQTYGFDRIAREIILFTRASAPAPGCIPARANALTGRDIWQIEQHLTQTLDSRGTRTHAFISGTKPT